MQRIKSIYELLSNYSKEEINNAISKLNEEDKHIIYLRYGSDLNNPNPSNWNPKYNGRFYLSIVKKIEKIIIKTRNGESIDNKKTIYELLTDYTKEEIDSIIEQLNEEEKNMLYLRYGNDLSNPDYSNWSHDYYYYFHHKLLLKMKKLLRHQREYKRVINGKLYPNVNTIYELLKEYPKELIDNAIEFLDDKDRNLLYLRYGRDLNNPDSCNWSMEYYIEFYKKLLPKLRRILKSQIDYATIYDYFKEYQKEEVDLAIKYLNFEDKQFLYLRYGSDLSNPDSSNWKAKYMYTFSNRVLLRIKKQLILNQNKRIENYLNCPEELDKDFKDINIHLLKTLRIIMQELKNDEYQSLLEMFSLKEILIVLLIKRLNNNYDEKDILKLFNITSNEFTNIKNRMLKILKYQEKNYFESVSNAFLEDSKVK